MNDQRSFERFVSDQVSSEAGGTPLPEDFYTDMHAYASRTRQRPEWLALIKEPPMRLTDTLAVGSPTIRAAAILAASLLLALAVVGAGIAGGSLLAAEQVIVVDADGGGDYETVVDAVAAAEDGETIRIMPGTYVGQLHITSRITLEGMGETEADVVIAFDGGDRASWPRESDGLPEFGNANGYGIFLEDSDATIRNLTLRGPQVADGIVISGGAPRLDAVTVFLEQPFDGPRDALIIVDSAAVVHDVDLNGWLGVSGTATISDSRLSCGSVIAGEGAAPVLSRNTFSDERDQEDCGWGLVIEDGATPTLIDNDISMDPGGIEIIGEGTNPTLRENRIHSSGGPVGASGAERTEATFRGISVQEGAAPTLIGNVLTDNLTGIFIDGSNPVVEGNTVTGSEIGVEIVNGAAPTLSGNSLCDNGTNVVADAGVEAAIEAEVAAAIDEANGLCEIS